MKAFRANLIVFILFGVIIAVHSWWFKKYLGVHYFVWYIKEASIINALASFISIMFININSHVNLISASPVKYLYANGILFGFNYRILELIYNGAQQQINQLQIDLISKQPSLSLLVSCIISLFIITLIIPVGLLLFLITLGWILFIVPTQYFFNLVAGAPARGALLAKYKLIACVKDGEAQVEKITIDEGTPNGWWDASPSLKPVSFTLAITAIMIYCTKVILTYLNPCLMAG